MEKFVYGNSLALPDSPTVLTTIKSHDNAMTYVEALFQSGYMATLPTSIRRWLDSFPFILEYVVWLGKLFLKVKKIGV